MYSSRPSSKGGGSESVTSAEVVAGLAGATAAVANLTVSGNLSVAGVTTTTNTATTISEQTVITNAGTGPALQVTQTGAQPVASFVDGEGVTALKIWDNGLLSIGSGTQPVERLEVTGSVKLLGTGATFIGDLSGNAATCTLATLASNATQSYSCTGYAGSAYVADVAKACTGNSLTATTAASCTGNAATATTAASCTGNSATATHVQWSGIQNWPINTNNFWSSDSNNMWLTTGNVGIGSTAPSFPLDVSGNIRATASVVQAFDAFTGVSAYTSISGTTTTNPTPGQWNINSVSNVDIWLNHVYKINPTSGGIYNAGNSYTVDASTEWIEYAVPAGMTTLYIQHMAFTTCGWFQVQGSTGGVSATLTPIRKVSNYTADSLEGSHPIEIVPYVDLYTYIRITGGKGHVHLEGFAWTKERRLPTGPGGCGHIHQDMLIPTIPTSPSIQNGQLVVPSASYTSGTQTTATLTFPTAFSAVPTVTCTPAFNLTGVWQLFLGINSVSTTGVTFGINNPSTYTTSAVVVTINWTATA